MNYAGIGFYLVGIKVNFRPFARVVTCLSSFPEGRRPSSLMADVFPLSQFFPFEGSF